jgi:hypothetical protein
VLACAERGDGVLYGGGIAVLTDTCDLIRVLAFVEAVACLLNDIAQIAAKAIPVFESDLVLRGRGAAKGSRDSKDADEGEFMIVPIEKSVSRSRRTIIV